MKIEYVLFDFHGRTVVNSLVADGSHPGPGGVLLSFFSRWPIRDRRGLFHGGERLLNGQQDSRLEGAQRSASADRDRRGRHRDVIRSLPQVVSVVFTEGIPETVQLSADRFDILFGRRSAVLGVLDELRPCGWRVTELGQV